MRPYAFLCCLAIIFSDAFHSLFSVPHIQHPKRSYQPQISTHTFRIANAGDTNGVGDQEDLVEDDLLTDFLKEANKRMTLSSNSVNQFQRRSLEYSAPPSIGGGRPEGPSPFLSPDAVVQHVVTGLLECNTDIDEGCTGTGMEGVHQAWRFSELHPDGDYAPSYRTSWSDGKKMVTRDEFECEIRSGVLLPFGDGVEAVEMLGLPIFDEADNDDSCLVRISLTRGQQIGVFLFRLVRGGSGLPTYSHSDCWLIREVIAS